MTFMHNQLNRQLATAPVMYVRLSLVCICVSFALDSLAFEFVTHAALTREAFMSSRLNAAGDDALLQMGIDAISTDFGSNYLDIGDDRKKPRERHQNLFDTRKIQTANKYWGGTILNNSAIAWTMRGAIREDDVPFDGGAVENTPQDDPDGQFARVLNHFLDPIANVGYAIFQPAPEWALTGVAAVGQGQNHFSEAHAREAMWRALTLTDYGREGSPSELPFVATPSIPSRSDLRIAYWATMFRSLGDVAHLLQDMAQPQHTRNDVHSGLFCRANECLGGHASYFEGYVEARATNQSSFRLVDRFFADIFAARNAIEEVLPIPLLFGGYPTPTLTAYRDYFTTATGPSNRPKSGLADYSNRGFYSIGTLPDNIPNYYPAPPRNERSLGRILVPAKSVVNSAGRPIDVGNLTLLTFAVDDLTVPSQRAPVVPLASLGAFNQFMKTASPQVSLNHYNYAEQARLLIPRAVAYSAGLIDYFFRGRMEINLPDAGIFSLVDHAKFGPASPTNATEGFTGFSTVRLKLKNTTADITPPQGSATPQPMPDGTLVAVFKFHRNICYRDNLDGETTNPSSVQGCRSPLEEIVVSEPLRHQPVAFGNQLSPFGPELAFRFKQQLPINAWDVVLQVVYRGRLGSEDDAVVVATKDISEPTFVTTYNDTDYVEIEGRCHTPATVAATQGLWRQLAPVCQNTSTTPRSVSAACANVRLNARHAKRALPTPLLVANEQNGLDDGRLPSRRFSRFAVLGERGVPVKFAMEASNPPYIIEGGVVQDEEFLAYQLQLGGSIDRYTTSRGVNTFNAVRFVINGQTALPGPGCPDADMSPLVGAERYPVPVAIAGWEEPENLLPLISLVPAPVNVAGWQ